jgi:predicted metalloprotease with PDZ domain
MLLALAALAAATVQMSVDVDLRDAPRRIFHSKLTLPAHAGRQAFLYPRWIPGEHGPNGPIADLAGLRFSVGNSVLTWQRDPVDMFRILVDVPQGAREVQAQLDFLSPPPGQRGFSGGTSATAHLAVLSWNQVLLYPEGAAARDLQVRASVRVPSTWKIATALAIESAGEEKRFAPVSLEALVDSPVLAGALLREVPIGQAGVPHFLDIAGESEDTVRLPPELKARYDALVGQAQTLFGAHHYAAYHFLLTLSDSVAHFGLEHHQSSDDRVPERVFLDEELRLVRLARLLPHEFTHSWNGKYRRPAGLATADFQAPMKGELLWVYEGLTDWLGTVLAARSGLWTPEQARDFLAYDAATMQSHRGRAWRPLEDTAVAAQVLFPSRDDWSSWRRDTDFYLEGDLLWLEVDAILRERSNGAKSLDDFCQLFLGGKSGPPEVSPYGFDDIVAALQQVVAYDWKTHLSQRVRGFSLHPPLDGLTRTGWKLDWGPAPNTYYRALERAARLIDARGSIGALFDYDKALVVDVVPDSPADRAHVPPGSRVLAVNGRKYSEERLRDAIADTARGGRLELLLENAETIGTFPIDWRGGTRYPRLARDESKPDVLTRILAPR